MAFKSILLATEEELKTELLEGRFGGLGEARLESSHYMAFYNAERRHSALGYLAPNHFETHLKTTSPLGPSQLDHFTLLDDAPFLE